MDEREYYASWSGGADSTATLILALLHGEPLRAAVYCEVMFDKETSAEIPEHRDFIYNTAIPWLKQNGVETVVLRAEKTAMDWMMSQVTKGPRKGKVHGFPLSGNKGWCSVKRDCKMPPIDAFRRQHPGAVYYEGICTDEKKRIKPEKEAQGSYLLVKYGYTQEAARKLCKEHGLLSPIYEFTNRGGCFFCPNARDGELRHLRKHHPDLWRKLLEIDMRDDTIRPGKFRVEEGLQDIERRFALEEAQITFDDLFTGNLCELRCGGTCCYCEKFCG